MVLKKGINFDLLSQEELGELHTEVHAAFSKVLSGEEKKFTIRDLYHLHKEISNALIRAGGKHIAPIDTLDNIELYEQDEVLEDYSYLEKERKLSKIEYSGEEMGTEIHLKDVLKEFEKFKLKEPFVYIVGGICNHGKTKGDIDILIKKSRPVDDREDIPLKFRIMRQLPKKYWQRLHFLYDDELHGPFTNYVPLYSLICEVNTKQVFEMSEDLGEIMQFSRAEQAAKSRSENKIVPFRFFTQPKPVHGRAREEIYSLETIEETMSRLKQWKDEVDKGIYIEKKFDGVRCQAHKVGKRVLIMTEEGSDVTSRIKTIADELSKQSHDFVVEFEAELWLKGKHQNRADSAGVLHTKDSDQEKFMVANLYDVLWFDGEDIHADQFVDRRKDIEKLKTSAHVKISDARLAKGFPAIKRMSRRFMSLPGSEGTIYKLATFVYELDGKSFNFMKFKKERSITAKVIAVHRVAKAEKTFYYNCAIEGNTYVGKTFNTNIKVSPGEKLEVVFVDLNQYTDPDTKKTWFNWWAPRVISKSSKPVTSIQSAKKIVEETSGQMGVKKVPKVSREELEEVLARDSISGEEKILKLSFQKRFVFQNHYRGKSCHADLRFERNGNLEGYTLMHQVEGEIKEPVMNLKDAAREDKDAKNFKINLKTGELLQDKIEIATKAMQPKVWLGIAPGISLSGMEAGVGKRPEPGATAKFPGVFTKIDSGTYEEGARKAQYFEYFLNGNILKGRYIVRVLSRARIAKEARVRTPFIWFFWKAKDETPYVLSSRGIRKEYVPEKGRSALPESWEEKIPKELRWWTKGLTGAKALEMIKEIRKKFLFMKKLEENTIGLEEADVEDLFVVKKGNEWCVTHSDGRVIKCFPTKEEADKMHKAIIISKIRRGTLSETKFALKRKWWKGQFVIRGMPVEHFEVRFDSEKYPWFKLNKNPLVVESGISGIKQSGRKEEVMFEGIIGPGKEGNPNKKIPAHIDILDSGSVNVIEDSENFMHVKFSGKKLKGNWIFKRSDPASNIWNVSKAELPKTKSMREFGSPLSEEEIRDVYFLSENFVGVSEIGRFLDRPNSTVYDWLKKLNLSNV